MLKIKNWSSKMGTNFLILGFCIVVGVSQLTKTPVSEQTKTNLDLLASAIDDFYPIDVIQIDNKLKYHIFDAQVRFDHIQHLVSNFSSLMDIIGVNSSRIEQLPDEIAHHFMGSYRHKDLEDIKRCINLKKTALKEVLDYLGPKLSECLNQVMMLKNILVVLYRDIRNRIKVIGMDLNLLKNKYTRQVHNVSWLKYKVPKLLNEINTLQYDTSATVAIMRNEIWKREEDIELCGRRILVETEAQVDKIKQDLVMCLLD